MTENTKTLAIKPRLRSQTTFIRSLLSENVSRVIMGSNSKLLAFMFAVILLASLVMIPAVSVKADSNEPLTFSSGLTLYSPVNTTYSSKVVECNGTFTGPRDYEIFLNYSIDGNYQGALPWTLNPASINNPSTYTLEWSFQLPQLPKGSHQLSIGIDEELFNSTGTLIDQTTRVNTVYFTTGSSQPPTVPELSLLAILPLIITVLSIAVILRHRKTTKPNECKLSTGRYYQSIF